MKHVQLIGGVALMLALHAAPAAAQANRTFVSGHGSDNNGCSLAAPCRSFQHAHDLTNASGEIAVLDTAGYGPVNITKAISIINQSGVEAGVTPAGGGLDGITINAGSSDVVNLRGLTLLGLGTGANGINFISAAVVNIQNCVIRGFGTHGIYAQPTVASTLTVTDTILSDNFSGAFVEPNAAVPMLVSFERVQILNNSLTGLTIASAYAGGAVHGTVGDSLISGNGTGISTGSGAVRLSLTVVGSKILNNGTGLLIAQTSTMNLAQSTVSGNTTHGYNVFSGYGSFLNSYGNNFITDTNNQGTPTTVTPQ